MVPNHRSDRPSNICISADNVQVPLYYCLIFWAMYIFVLSANNEHLEVKNDGSSAVKRNSSGPKTELWGTPLATRFWMNNLLPTLTRKVGFERKVFIRFNLPLMQQDLNFKRNLRMGTLSKAEFVANLEKSTCSKMLN